MKLNTNSNSYIIIYSAILVIIVAFLLAFIFKALKPMQDANVALDIKKQILYSLNIRGLDGSEAEAKYAEVVKEEKDVDGQKIYLCDIDGEEICVFSLKGMGLWGGISGYLAIHDQDGPTVYGAYFNHESETAGLGAEIKDSQAWQEKFIGKKVFKGGEYGSIALSVVKNVDDAATQVDCVTGATLTSNGVNDMIHAGLSSLMKEIQQGVKECGTKGCGHECAKGRCHDAAKECDHDGAKGCKHEAGMGCKEGAAKECGHEGTKGCKHEAGMGCKQGAAKECDHEGAKGCCADKTANE